jgi:Xaa-Pro aminopeptidase
MAAHDAPLPDAARVRAALVARRAALSAAWQAGGLDGTVVLIPAGLMRPVEGSDQHYAFRAHDDHAWVAGSRAPAQVLAYDPDDGWVLFAYQASREERVWLGETEAPEAQGERLGIGCARPVGELGPWLARRAGRPAALLGGCDVLERPAGYGLKPGEIEALAFDPDLGARAQAAVTAGRTRKDDVERAWMRAAAAASRAGHLHALETARAGMSERALQVEVDYAFERAGAERPAYGTIAASGPHAAVLHATPGARTLAEGELLLLDAGAEVAGYDSDVTRTWPVRGPFRGAQGEIYDLVLEVQQAAIREARPGVEFRDLHLATCRRIARGLVHLGLLRGDPDGLVERDAHALFFPHGLGHLIGLATHDVGGMAPGRTRSARPGLAFLRIDLPLEAGHVVTVEPGVYLVPALLRDPELRDRHRDDVDWARADALLGLGGVRIEDDVLVTEDGPEVLTEAIPRTRAEIEALRA